MTRKVTEQALVVFEEEEGFVSKPYYDAVGVLTQGIGHTNMAGAPKITAGGPAWSREYARQVLSDDLTRVYLPAVEQILGPDAPQCRYDAGALFGYNVGNGNLKTASWVKAIKEADQLTGAPLQVKVAEVKARFGMWNKAGGRVLKGLTKRRAREARIACHGDYSREGSGLTFFVKASSGPIILNPPEPLIETEDAKAWALRNLSVAEVKEIQRALAGLGLYKLAIDGDYGDGTVKAVVAFQKTHPDLLADGKAGRATQAQLQRQQDMKKRLAVGASPVGASAPVYAAAVQTVEPAHLWAVQYGATAMATIGVAYLAYAAWFHGPELRATFNRLTGREVA